MNVWLETFGRRVEHLLVVLERYRMAGSYGGELDLGEIGTLFRGAYREITKLHSENFNQAEEIKRLKKLIPVEPVTLKEEIHEDSIKLD